MKMKIKCCVQKHIFVPAILFMFVKSFKTQERSANLSNFLLFDFTDMINIKRGFIQILGKEDV